MLIDLLLIPGKLEIYLPLLFVLLTSPHRRLALILTQSLLFAYIFNGALKAYWQVPLPEGLLSTSYAFPSGHMHIASIFYGLPVIYWRSRKGVILSLCVLTSLGYALWAHGFHYPADILAGAFIGIFVAFISVWLFHLSPLADHWLSTLYFLLACLSMAYDPFHGADAWIILGCLFAMPLCFYDQTQPYSWTLENLLQGLTTLILMVALASLLHLDSHRHSPYFLFLISAIMTTISLYFLKLRPKE